MIRNLLQKLPAVAASLALLAPGAALAGETSKTTVASKAKPTAAEAKAFATRVNDELKAHWIRSSTAEWIKSTYITDDTERNAALANEALMEYLSRTIRESRRFDGVEADPETRRMLSLLRLASSLPAPSDEKKRAELAGIAAKLEGMYGKGKWCGEDGKQKCRDLGELSETLAQSRDYDQLLDAWTGWRSISREMRPLYQRQVELANEGAREVGFSDLGELWRAGYDMSPAAFEAETERLWQQVKPLYEDLHCYVRGKLAESYGEKRIPEDGAIPAHVLGNMWAQEWTNVYPLVEPYKGQPSLDVDSALKKQKYDATRMVKLGESFFTSLGLDPLPASFYERSQFVKPRDRDVVCHASAWDVTLSNDLRIKMCIKQTEEDLVTIHHELGHNYYFMYYWQKPVLFQNGAHDGFHEAIGDAIALSITPGYLKQVGLLSETPKDDKGLINFQMKMALSKIAFLPFGKLIDQWRWDVFSGKVKPADYNAHWWKLREQYQGVKAPVARSEKDFDPGAKFHIPGNTPYTRYFLAHVLQFQMHKAMCDAAGFEGDLSKCSIYGSKEAGKKLQAMLAMGSSKPWPDALEALTGSRQMDATAMLAYFAPLRTWLKEQNAGQKCGW
ncbi:M2 family metallopeptidase [Vulgatibacter sp.]|uniref:M2 family metallopeptidase n=1 Tax=Vulgatibacter sp. TaxID=1971226 RepID=UPI00356873F3